MKRSLFSLLLIFMALCASAQSYWGVRAGWDGYFPGNWNMGGEKVKMFQRGSGFAAGVIYNHPIVGGLYIEPGVGITYNSYRWDITFSEDLNADKIIEDPKVRKFGFRVPVRLGYYFDIFPSGGGVSIFTGPQFDLGVSAKLNLDDDECEVMNIDKNLYNDFWGYRRCGLSWTAGANMYIGSWVVDLCGSFGLNDMHKGMISFREYRLTIGLGYNF